MRFAMQDHLQVRTDDGRIIPADPENADYAALISSGAVIAPYLRFYGTELAQARAVLTAEVDAEAGRIRAQIAGTSDPTKLSVYTEKYQIALRALAGDAAALALLAPEAAARGESPEQLALLVRSLGDHWRAASFQIEAASAAHKAAIAALSDIEAASAYDTRGGWGG